MTKRLMYAGLVAVGLLAFGAASYAVAPDDGDGSHLFSARLHGYQEVPVISTTGHGFFIARLNEEGNAIEYKLSYADLEGTMTTGAHIHPGQRSVNGGVAAFLCGGGGKPECPPTSGSVEGVITPADVIGPAGQGFAPGGAPGEFDELVRAMRAGVTYANVHTNKHPGGEIRGQIRNNAGRGSDH